jgi:hypothetical protein
MGVAEDAMRLAASIAWQWTQAPGLTGSNEPVGDSLQTLAQHSRSLGIEGRVLFGQVVDYVPYCSMYKLAPEKGGPIMDACRLGETGGTPLGVADATTLQVNTPVYFIKHPEASYAIIIGVEPPFMHDARLARSDNISQGSNCGLQVEPAHQAPFKMGPEGSGGGITDWSARTPQDSCGIGEWTRVAETGLMLQMDSYMMQMRVDESCGLTMFYWDQFARLAGYNFQHWTSGHEQESYDDEGEHAFYDGLATYPWEQRGRLKSPGALAKERTAQETQIDEPWFGRLEPEEDDTQPYHRLKCYGGYLGQGRKLHLSTPLHADADKEHYEDFHAHPGLHDDVITLSGRRAIRTALSWSIGKRPNIPTPKRIKLVQDDTGDNQTNYKASGYEDYGDGDEHKVTSEIKTKGDYPHLERALGVLDLHAHIFNWESEHPFHYHKEDYYIPDEAAAEVVTTNWEKIDFNKLKDDWWLEPPKPIEVKIDHREGGTAKVFPNSSYITGLDDGGVVIGDGFGCEIVMSGGTIRLTAPGDIFFESGRNTMAWAGRDVILRAKKSIDLTATDNDVRIKAEKNMQLLAANGGGKHGMLLESRSTSLELPFEMRGHEAEYSGIILRSKEAPIINWGSYFFVKTMGASGTQSAIVLDANDGKSPIAMRGRYVDSWVDIARRDYFVEAGAGIENGNVEKACSWNGNQNVVSGSLYTDRGLGTKGGLIAEHSIYSTTGSFASTQGEHITKLPDGAAANLDGQQKYLDNEITQGNTDRDQLNSAFYGDKHPGHAATIKRGEGSLRTEYNYGSSKFVLYESRWAQLAAGTGQSTDFWNETVVTCQVGEDTYPFPGKKKWLEEESYYQMDNNLYDTFLGNSKDRGELFEEPEYADPGDPIILDGNYPIVG